MLEGLFGKGWADRLFAKIAESTGKYIAANNPQSKLDIEKKKLEVELLQRQVEEQRIKKEKTLTDNTSNAQNKGFKFKWDKLRSIFRLKVGEKEFKTLLLSHKESSSPQAVQGMWQAYGQMRAGRITGRYAVLATGVLGSGLWIYQKYLSKQKNELEGKEKELENKKIVVNDNMNALIEERNQWWKHVTGRDAKMIASYKIILKELDKAEQKIKELCKDSVECYNIYQISKDEIEKGFRAELEETEKKFDNEYKEAAEKMSVNTMKPK